MPGVGGVPGTPLSISGGRVGSTTSLRRQRAFSLGERGSPYNISCRHRQT